jgi:hypothetical protein
MRAMYKLRRKTMGSKKLRVKGLTSDIITMSFVLISLDMISGSQISLSLPVSFRKRFVRR